MNPLHTGTWSRMTDDMSSRFDRGLEPFLSFAREYHEDADFRLRAESEPLALLNERGLSIPVDVDEGDVDVRILANTEDVFYLLMPPDPNVELADEDLGVVAGGKTAGSAGTAGTVGSVATTLSTASTGGTAGSAS